MVRRAIELVGTGTVLELSKATSVKTNSNMIHLDELPDGTWRLIYNSKMIPDFTKIKSFRIIREPEDSENSEYESLEEIKQKYHELLYAVAKKYAGETRHQTALRYIKECEEESCDAARDVNYSEALLEQAKRDVKEREDREWKSYISGLEAKDKLE